jgi:separase
MKRRFVRDLPDASMIKQALQHHDLLRYCGHGSETEFCDYTVLLEKYRECHVSLLLMGCSSGESTKDGEMDPFGVPYSYVGAGAGAGCVVANLSNVTDRDIDRFLMELLCSAVMNGPFDLAGAVIITRQICELKYLIGAAPRIYGFLALVHRKEE